MPSAEEDYLDRAREIWQDYQFYVYIGLAMILAVIAGFTLSHSSYDEERAGANEKLYALLKQADDDQVEEAEALFAQLQASPDYAELAHMGAFVMASLYFAREQFADAAQVLRPAVSGSEDEGIRQLAALRVAEALIGGGSYAQAAELLRQNKPAQGRLRVMFEERIGDAYFAADDIVAASEAYEAAMGLAEEGAPFYMPLLAIKRGALLSDADAARAARLQRESEQAAAEAAAAAAAANETANETANDTAPDINTPAATDAPAPAAEEAAAAEESAASDNAAGS